MNQKMIEFNKNLRGSKKIDFKPGDVVKIHLKIKESGKERVQIFEGLLIGVKGRQSSSPTITVRKISHGVGVEMILPLLSKNVEKITLVKKAKVRRSKLYYVRDLTSKQSRMKYKEIKEFIKEESPAAEIVQEKAEEKKEVKEEKDKKTKKTEEKK
jgi:large subunit ribosomal protein L19